MPSDSPSIMASPGTVHYNSTPSSLGRPKEQVISNDDGMDLPQKVLFPPERLNVKWTQVHSIGAGLQNMGNTCFLNSTLQCLTYAPPFANYMLTQEHSKTCHESGFCMMCIMQNHIIQVFAHSGEVIVPMEVLNKLTWIGKQFNAQSQEDAHEFLQHTVDAMQRSCLPDTILDRQTQTTTFIHQVFGGHLRSRVKCLNCKAVSDTFEPFLDISLGIQMFRSITKALEQFVRPEQLGGDNAYKCSECKEMVTASKGVTLHRSANVLTLSLKRFADSRRGKIAKYVSYSEYLDLRPFMSQSQGDPEVYGLFAVLVHLGSTCKSGHYYCYIKASDGQWYKMNDSSVSVSDIRSVLNQQAYVLFYSKEQEYGRRWEQTHHRPREHLHSREDWSCKRRGQGETHHSQRRWNEGHGDSQAMREKYHDRDRDETHPYKRRRKNKSYYLDSHGATDRNKTGKSEDEQQSRGAVQGYKSKRRLSQTKLMADTISSQQGGAYGSSSSSFQTMTSI